MTADLKTHIIGAYGTFWSRDEVNWNPGPGPAAWQLLGRINKKKGPLRVCDFRRAQGFYVLFDEHRANYVGLARGTQGIGSRLRAHHTDKKKNWERFSWFAFDDVVDGDREGWSVLKRRAAVAKASSDVALRESEALLITVLGTKQNEMLFQSAKRWEQLRAVDSITGGIAKKVDHAGFTDSWWRAQAEET